MPGRAALAAMRAGAARKGAHGERGGEQQHAGRQDGEAAGGHRTGHRAGTFLACWLSSFARIRRMLKCALTSVVGAGRIRFNPS